MPANCCHGPFCKQQQKNRIMTKFKKGESGNPSGRPRGAENRATGDLREVISGVLSQEMTPAKLKAILSKLKPEMRLNYMIKLTDFVLPKLKQTDMNLNFEEMTEEQLTVIVDRILTPKNETNE